MNNQVKKLIEKKINIILFLFISIGLILLGMATYRIYGKTIKINDLPSTKAINTDVKIYHRNNDGNTYRYSLIYSYTVDNINYTIVTGYYDKILPKLGREQIIKYNPNNPREAFLTGLEEDICILFVSFMLIIIPIFMLFWQIEKNKITLKLQSVFSGAILIIASFFILYFMCATTEGFSLSSGFENVGPFLSVPFIFVFIGIYNVLAAFIKAKKNVILEVTKIDFDKKNNKYNIIFEDPRIPITSYKAKQSKFYIYETPNDIFIIGQRYKINVFKYDLTTMESIVLYDYGEVTLWSLRFFKDEDFETYNLVDIEK